MHWLTVEVFDAEIPARGWLRAWHDALVETAVAAGAVFWDSHEHRWGVVVEFTFDEEAARDRFRAHPTLTAALDATPDPVNGTLVYPHRGGGTGVRVPRRPAPHMSSGAAALPEPVPLIGQTLVGDYLPPRDGLAAPPTTSVASAA